MCTCTSHIAINMYLYMHIYCHMIERERLRKIRQSELLVLKLCAVFTVSSQNIIYIRLLLLLLYVIFGVFCILHLFLFFTFFCLCIRSVRSLWSDIQKNSYSEERRDSLAMNISKFFS